MSVGDERMDTMDEAGWWYQQLHVASKHGVVAEQFDLYKEKMRINNCWDVVVYFGRIHLSFIACCLRGWWMIKVENVLNFRQSTC